MHNTPAGNLKNLPPLHQWADSQSYQPPKRHGQFGLYKTAMQAIDSTYTSSQQQLADIDLPEEDRRQGHADSVKAILPSQPGISIAQQEHITFIKAIHNEKAWASASAKSMETTQKDFPTLQDLRENIQTLDCYGQFLNQYRNSFNVLHRGLASLLNEISLNSKCLSEASPLLRLYENGISGNPKQYLHVKVRGHPNLAELVGNMCNNILLIVASDDNYPAVQWRTELEQTSDWVMIDLKQFKQPPKPLPPEYRQKDKQQPKAAASVPENTTGDASAVWSLRS